MKKPPLELVGGCGRDLGHRFGIPKSPPFRSEPSGDSASLVMIRGLIRQISDQELHDIMLNAHHECLEIIFS